MSQKPSNHPVLDLTVGTPLLSKGGEIIGYQYYNFLLLFRGGVPRVLGGRWCTFEAAPAKNIKIGQQHPLLR